MRNIKLVLVLTALAGIFMACFSVEGKALDEKTVGLIVMHDGYRAVAVNLETIDAPQNKQEEANYRSSVTRIRLWCAVNKIPPKDREPAFRLAQSTILARRPTSTWANFQTFVHYLNETPLDADYSSAEIDIEAIRREIVKELRNKNLWVPCN